MTLKQYHMYEFDLGTRDKGQENVIYGVIISPDEMNDVLKTVIYAPLCNQCAITPTTFLIDDITRIRLDQLTTIEKDKATKFIDKVANHKIKLIKDTLNEMFIK